MTAKFNKKKFSFFLNTRKIIFLFIFIFFISIFFLIYNQLKDNINLNNLIQDISNKYNYRFTNYETNSLSRVDETKISKILNKYKDQSIFLLPLKEISDSIRDINWVKSVDLSTNLKNKVKIEIEEYRPIGLFFNNNKLFFFSNEGVIIDKYMFDNNEKFIIFHGSEVLKNANAFLLILNKLGNINLLNIKEAHYINNRRWDIKLVNDMIINLSEKNLKESLINYNNLIKKLSKNQINTIKNIDLRNNEKAIIRFK